MLKRTRRTISVLLCLAIVLSSVGTIFASSVSSAPIVKNIIYMIPDGGGMAPFYLSDAVKQAGGFDPTVYPNATPVEKEEMSIKQYLVGAETTYSANSDVTDSAASGTALSSGYKTNNGYIGIDSNQKPHANILEACQDMGKNTGIVLTYEWTNATPAAFSAHDVSRYNMTLMSEQIVNQGIDVVIGNTHSAFSSQEWFTDSALSDRGYKVIKNREALESVKAGDRIWGKLPTAYYDFRLPASTPRLVDYTKAALTALDDGNENGFFLMVEGSTVDGGAHSNNAVEVVSEYLAFDAACKVAIEFAKKRTDTVVIIAPDHDTGGLYYDYSDLSSIVSDIQKGTNPSTVLWSSTGHTARNGGVFIYAPEGVSYPTGIDISKKDQVASEFYSSYGDFSSDYPSNPVNVIDNTEIPKYLFSLINADIDAVTEKLFVDVTDMGTYDEATKNFTFKDMYISIKRNSSTAYVCGMPVSLDGEIAVYINGRFYVPQKIFDIDIYDELEIIDGLALYANYNTGEISLSGNTSVPNAPLSLLITKPGSTLSDITDGSEIVALDQVTSGSDGRYAYTVTVPRLAGEYVFYNNYRGGPSTASERSFALKNTIPTLAVTSNDVVISDMSQLKSGDDLDITISGFDLESDYPGVVIVAQYMDGSLISADNVNVDGGSIYFGDEIEKTVSVASGTDMINIFYWNRNTYMPLTASYLID